MFNAMIETLKANPRKIVFTEGHDARILEATDRLVKGGFLTPILIGNVDVVKANAAKGGYNIEGVEIIDPETYPEMDAMVDKMVELRKGKMTADECRAALKKSNYFGTMLVKMGLVDSLLGTLMTGDAAVWFASFSTQPYSVIPYHVIVVAGTLLTLFLGAHSIEKSNKVMMPLFFIIFLVLAVRVALLPGSAEGYKFMFTPRWEALKDPMIWIWAMGQAFFSLSVTGSGMIVYGAYLSKDEDVVGVAQHTAIFDTIAAVVAALVIIPACFSYGLDVGAGPSLLFVTLPTILQDIPLGRLFAVILYVAMIFAGVSSLQNMFEAVAESLLHKFPKLSRAAVLGILCVLCLGFGLLMEPISKWGPWMDLVSIYIIPIGATLGAVSWFYIMKKDDLLAAVNTGSRRRRGALWYGVGRYVYVPLAVILCCVALFMNVAF